MSEININVELGYKLAFKVWLEKEFPFHGEYDFDTWGSYENWKRQLFIAYVAGASFERSAVNAGM